MAVRVDRGVGGLDISAQLGAFIEQSATHNQEMRRIFMDMSSMLAQATMGGYGRQSVSQQAQATSAARSAAQGATGTLAGGANPLAGQTSSLTPPSSGGTQGGPPPFQPPSPTTNTPVGGTSSLNPGPGSGAPLPPPPPGGGGGGGSGPGQPPLPPPGPGQPAPRGPGGNVLAGISGGGQGGGLTNSILDKMKQNVPFASTLDSGIKFIRSEQNKNLFYETYGGTGTAGAYKSRIDEEIFRLQNVLSLNEDEARTISKGVTALGYDGASNPQIDPDLLRSIGVSAKRDLGIMPESFLQMTAMAQRQGNDDMQGIGRLLGSLEQLRDAANDAGMNVDAVTQAFLQMNQEAINFAGPRSGTQIANQLVKTQTRWGNALGGIDLNAYMQNTGQQYLQAGMMGMTPGGALGVQIRDPQGYAASRAQTGGQTVEAYIQGADPYAWDRLQSLVAARRDDIRREGKGGDVAREVAEQWIATSWGPNTGLTPEVLMQLLQQFYGISAPSLNEAIAYYIVELAGKGIGGDRDPKTRGSFDSQGRALSGPNKGKVNSDYTDQGISKRLLEGGPLPSKVGPFQRSLSEDDQFVMNSIKSGKAGRSGAMVDFLAETDLDTKVEIQFKGGETRTMTVRDAIKNGFGSQIESGMARFARGGRSGESTSTVAGANSAAWADAEQSAQRSADGFGQSIFDLTEKFNRIGKVPKSGESAASLGPQIGLTDDAKRLVKLMDRKGGGWDRDDANGNPRSNRITDGRGFSGWPPMGG